MSVNIEQMIIDYCQNGKCKLMTAHRISHQLKLNTIYGPKGKQLVGMAIARLKKKNIFIEYKN